MFYTYLWLRYNGTPYYVGKGSGSRAFINSAHGVHKPVDESRIILQDHPTEEEAFEAEIFLIAFYGRLCDGTGCLRNIAEGGQNPPKAFGRVWPEEHKAKMRARFEGIPLSDEHRKKLSMSHMGQVAWNKGIPFSKEARDKMSKAHKGHKRTHCNKGHEMTNENLYVSSNGHRRCKICRKDSNKAHQERKPKTLVKRKVGAQLGNKSNLGRKLSEDHKRNISKGLLRRSTINGNDTVL